MSRGVVLSVDEASAIVFTSDCRLVKVSSRKGVILGREIIIETPPTARRTGSRVLRPLLAFAAALFAVIAGSSFPRAFWLREPMPYFRSTSIRVFSSRSIKTSSSRMSKH